MTLLQLQQLQEKVVAAKQHFESLRFDYEELAEQLIEDEEYNSAGKIEIKPLT